MDLEMAMSEVYLFDIFVYIRNTIGIRFCNYTHCTKTRLG